LSAPSALLEGFEATAAVHAPAADGLHRVDIGVAHGVFCRPQDLPDATRVDATNWTILPRFIDAHVHLDKSLSVSETGLADGTLLGAIQTYMQASQAWTQSHFEHRMELSVRDAISAGTGHMRSHIDCFGDLQGSQSWAAARAIKNTYKDVLTIELAPLTSITRCDDPSFPKFCRDVAEQSSVLGVFVAPGMCEQSVFEQFLNHAQACGLDVDFHIDENLSDPSPAIEHLADAIIATDFSGRVMAGHVCALLNAAQDDFDRILGKISAAQIAIVTLPRTNLYLQDRTAGTTPRRRGITAINEMRALGISVSFGTDNVADAFFPFGDYDLLSLFRDTVVAAHLDQDLNNWMSAITQTPAQALGLKESGMIAASKRADAILVPGSNWPDLLNSAKSDRIILVGGAPLDLDAIGRSNQTEATSCD
jgi:cytosine deaminase